MAFGLKCPDCRKTFRWDVAKDFPDECPLCGAQMPTDKTDDDNVIAMPQFLSARTRSIDASYRQLETSSEARVQEVAAKTGASVSELSDMKITNIRDQKHEGDVAAMPVVNAVTQQMDLMKARGGTAGFAGEEGIAYSGVVKTGHYPNAGAKAINVVRQMNSR